MKKIYLFFIAAFLCLNGFAQHAANIHAHSFAAAGAGATSRTTAIGDTFQLSNIAPADTLTLYSFAADSGYVYGMNAFGDQGFAERYDFNGTDSSVTVLGVMAQFGGTVNPLSANTVSFMLYDITAPIQVSASFGYSGYPTNGYDTVTVPVTALGIGPVRDTLKSFLFPMAYSLNYSFFIGYNINYNFSTLSGDTIGLASSINGDRISVPYTVTSFIPDSGATTYDTLINVQNATQYSDQNWYDNYAQSDSLYNNLAIFPIVAITNPSGISKVTRGNLSLYGNYPNPASTTTNIKFSLAQDAKVTIQLADMSGKIISIITDNTLSAGTHVVPVSVAALTPGNYLYIIQSSAGSIAGQMTVVR